MAFHSNEVIVANLTVKTLTVPTTGFSTGAIISIEDNPIRITMNGTDPNNTTKNGIKLSVGSIFEIIGIRDMKALKVIRADVADASVSVNYQQED